MKLKDFLQRRKPVEEIKRYRCIKACVFDACDDNGFSIENTYKYVEAGSIWQESRFLIAGGPDNVHLDREDSEQDNAEWCEPLRDTLSECLVQIESIFI